MKKKEISKEIFELEDLLAVPVVFAVNGILDASILEYKHKLTTMKKKEPCILDSNYTSNIINRYIELSLLEANFKVKVEKDKISKKFRFSYGYE